MAIKYLKAQHVKDSTVLLRVDMNVPLDSRGRVSDDFRIEAVIPTINLLLKQGCKVIITAHLGRPKGSWNEKFTMKPVAQRLAELLKAKFVETDKKIPDYGVKHVIFFKGDIRKELSRRQVCSAAHTDIVFLENIRFYKEEEANDPYFAKQLASIADVYVNDAFGVDHRAGASVSGVAKHLPAYAGLLLEREIKSLQHILKTPKKPFVFMMAGIKISDKAKTLENVGKRADKILLGGGIANLFFLAKGLEVGLSKVEKEAEKIAWHIEKNFKNKIMLPLDLVVSNSAMDKSSIRVAEVYDVKKKELILDIGPRTILAFSQELKKAKTIVWNGPLGYFEKKPFDTGTMALARLIGGMSKGRCYGVVGGGETVNAVRNAKQQDYIDHLSTGGGAMLEFLAGDKLPGIKALE